MRQSRDPAGQGTWYVVHTWTSNDGQPGLAVDPGPTPRLHDCCCCCTRTGQGWYFVPFASFGNDSVEATIINPSRERGKTFTAGEAEKLTSPIEKGTWGLARFGPCCGALILAKSKRG